METLLNPIRLLFHKAQDMSLPDEAAKTLVHAAVYLDEQSIEDKVSRWIEGRL